MSEQLYKPSLRNTDKYTIYFHYFAEYIKHKDFKSLFASIRYVVTHKLPAKGYQAISGLGKFMLRKNTNDFQYINYAYEKPIKDYLWKNMDTFDVFIDAGACIGEYSVWLGNMGKRCIAIEPVNYDALAKNVSLNNLEDRVQTFKCGVGEKKEMVYFQMMESQTGSSHIDREADHEPNVLIETIDELSARFNILPTDRVIMKLDVENMEKEVIAGAREFMKSRKDLRIIFEDWIEDNLKNDKLLNAVTPFEFHALDNANRLAIKF